MKYKSKYSNNSSRAEFLYSLNYKMNEFENLSSESDDQINNTV